MVSCFYDEFDVDALEEDIKDMEEGRVVYKSINSKVSDFVWDKFNIKNKYEFVNEITRVLTLYKMLDCSISISQNYKNEENQSISITIQGIMGERVSIVFIVLNFDIVTLKVYYSNEKEDEGFISRFNSHFERFEKCKFIGDDFCHLGVENVDDFLDVLRLVETFKLDK